MSERTAALSRGFAKLDCGIVDSSIWLRDHDVLRVWVALLAKCDALGVIRAAAPAMARLCFLTLERFEEIVAELEAPDPHSRTAEHEGRRLRRIEGGWILLNYLRYRELAQRKAGSHAERQARYRARLAERDEIAGESVTRDASPSRVHKREKKKQTEKETKEKAVAPLPPGLDTPKFREAWSEWQAYRAARKQPKWIPQTINATLAEWSEWGPERAAAAIRHSIKRGWLSVNEEKGIGSAKGSAIPAGDYGEENRAAWDARIQRNG